MKKVLAALLLMAIPALAQEKSANFAYKYDVASDTVTYCATNGVGGDPYGSFISGSGTVETSGSSTTVTGVDAAADVFASVNPGDIFSVRFPNGNTENRVIVTNADADTITVDTAINLSAGYTWSYKSLTCGTAVTDGWITVAGFPTVQMGVTYVAGDVTALAATWECVGGAIGAASQRVYPGVSSDCGDGTLNGTVCEFTTVGDALTYKITDNAFSACRVGVAWVTADGATRDEITVTIDLGR